MNRSAIFVSSCLLLVAGQARAVQEPAEARPSQRELRLVPFFEMATVNLTVEPSEREEDEEDGKIQGRNFEPNAKTNVGLKGVYGDLTLSASVRMPRTQDAESEKGRTRYFDQSASWAKPSWRADATYQNYEGFYSEEKGAPALVVPGMRVRNVEVKAAFTIGSTGYSLRDTWDSGAVPVKGGSPLLAIGAQALEATGLREGLEEVEADLEEIEFQALHLSGGYGYSYVKGRGFGTGMMTLGPSLQRVRLRVSDRDVRRDTVGTRLRFRLAGGYGDDQQLYGMAWDLTSSSVEEQGIEMDYSSMPIIFFGSYKI